MHARQTVPTSEGVPQQKPSKAIVCISPQHPQSLTGIMVGQAALTKPERWVCSNSTAGLTQPEVVAEDEELKALVEERHARRRRAAARPQAATRRETPAMQRIHSLRATCGAAVRQA